MASDPRTSGPRTSDSKTSHPRIADPGDPWTTLAAHQRGPDGFCRTCRDHWPCTANAQALQRLTEIHHKK